MGEVGPPALPVDNPPPAFVVRPGVDNPLLAGSVDNPPPASAGSHEPRLLFAWWLLAECSDQ